MKHRKRDTASGVSSNRSSIARAMRARMPKIPDNFAPLEVNTEIASTPAPQMTNTTDSNTPAPQSSEILIAAPPTCRTAELQLPSNSAPIELLQHVVPKTLKRAQKTKKIWLL